MPKGTTLIDDASLEEFRCIIEDAMEGATLVDILWRLRTLYRIVTQTNPWPED